MDSMTGMVVGSLAYRMRGQGLILALYGSQQPHLEMVHMFNLDAQSISIIQVTVTCELCFCPVFCFVFLDPVADLGGVSWFAT